MFTFCIRLLCSAMTLNNSEEWSDEIWSLLTESAVTKNCSYSKCWLSKVPSSPIPAAKIKICVHCFKYSPFSNALCSRNFQNVKLRLDFCRNLIILPQIQFYVKYSFGEFKRPKNVIFGNFGDSELWILVNFWLESC